MTNTISVATNQGWQQMPVMHKNGALQVVEVQIKEPELMFFYNVVHANGFRLPKTDTENFADAMKICNWCVENFPEFAKTDLNILDISVERKEQFNEQLWRFRFEVLRDWEDDDDFPF
jgi:hypothetical protein